MSKKYSKIAVYMLVSVFLTLGLSISLQSLLADWDPPILDPPDGNTPPLINTSIIAQGKTGDFFTGGALGGNSLGILTNATIIGDLTAANINGNGSGLTSLNASQLTSGTVPNARLDADLQDLADGTLSASKVQYGTYFITTAGTNGQFWKSDGSGAGLWAADRYNSAFDTEAEIDAAVADNGYLTSGDNLGNHSATSNLDMNNRNITEVNNIYADEFIYISDKSFKDNVRPVENALDKILKLEGIVFEWKKNGETNLGLIAQDVELVFPDLVVTDEETGLKAVKYGNLVSPLIEAIKEQQVQAENQQKQIEELKLEIEKLK